jgi:hypothetical protein
VPLENPAAPLDLNEQGLPEKTKLQQQQKYSASAEEIKGHSPKNDEARSFAKLEPDGGQIEKFVDAIFRHADPNGIVAVRSFLQHKQKPFRSSPTPLTGGLPFLVEVAVDDARRAAQYPKPVNFCPPLATFTNKVQATQEDLLEGFAISVECDEHPRAALATLEEILGPPTVVVKSGGVWANGGGPAEDKLHLHYRLAKPARGDDLAKLKLARKYARAIVGGDLSNDPVNHPIRWPGSWHRKFDPRLCVIEELNADREIDLEDALARLEQAIPDDAKPVLNMTRDEDDLPPPELEEIAFALDTIANGDIYSDDYPEWLTVGMAVHAGTGGSSAGCDLWDKFSQRFPDNYNEGACAKKWESFKTGGATTVATLFHMASQADPNWRADYDAELEQSIAEANRNSAKFFEFLRDKVDQNRERFARAEQSNDAEAVTGSSDRTKSGAGSSHQSDDTKSGAGSSHQQNGAKADADADTTSRSGSSRQQSGPIPLHWHGEQQVRPRWLVRNRLPETGVALFSGQWGTGKTFMLLEMFGSVLMGSNFLGEPTRRRGGMLIFAAEGASELPVRLEALVERKLVTSPRPELPLNGAETLPRIDPKRLPIVWAAECPPLSNKNLKLLVAAAEEAAERLKEDYGVPLVAIGIDTMAAAASFKDENDNGEAQRAMNVLRKLSEATGALVIAVDHFGKDTNTGTRGASAKEAAADAVLALLGERQVMGRVTNLRLCLRKVRGGPTGREFPFRLETVALGKDEEGDPIVSCVVDWTVTQEQNGAAKARPRSSHMLWEALTSVLRQHGEEVQPPGEGSDPVRAVQLNLVREEFAKRYGRTVEAAREAFRRALKGEKTDVACGVIRGEKYLWSKAPI